MIDTGQTAIGWALSTDAAEGARRTLTQRMFLDRLSGILFVGMFLLIAVYTVVRPDYNWDMVAYVAAALEDEIQDPVALHAETWREIEKGAQPAQLYEIQQGNPYNVHQWTNPVDFESQLSMYRVKVGYIWMLQALAPLAGMVDAAIMLSIIPTLVIGGLCLLWLREADAVQGMLIVGPALIVSDLFHMATAITPDMMLAAVSLTAIYMLWKGKDLAACLLLFASVFVRPDNIVVVFAFLVTAVLFGWRLLPFLVTFVASLGACVVISKLGDHPGWWAHFYFSCVQIQNSMVDFHPPFTITAFLHGYVRGTLVALADNDWPPILVICLAAWALLAKAGRIPAAGRGHALLFAMAIGTLGKFASFPLPDDRFYFVTIAGMAILLVVLWKPRFDVAPARN
ncbi:MAG: hypothetical protein KF914_13935 [Rhizobiaceae bacterium]|nr:hypothetical protein [Rhizobiaceae bacterium]